MKISYKIMHADTEYDAEEMLKDYERKILKSLLKLSKGKPLEYKKKLYNSTIPTIDVLKYFKV